MTEEEIITYLKSLPGAVVETVAADSDAPQIASRATRSPLTGRRLSYRQIVDGRSRPS